MDKTGYAAPPPPPPSQPLGYPVPPSVHYHYDDEPAYVLLPAYPLRRRRRRPDCRCCGSLLSSSSLLALLFTFALLAIAFFFLWPSDPDLRVVRLRLDRVHVTTNPLVALDVSLGLELRIRNPDFFSIDYNSVVVAIWYRGRKLGLVTSAGGHVRARGVSYVDAELHLNGIQILSDAFYLIEDLAKGSIPFDTVTEVSGQLHLLFFDVPIKGKVSCAVKVNPENQTIARQDCYPG